MDDQLLKPIIEASYLTAANAWRYRAILRYFYIQHESMRHQLFPSEILEYLRQSLYFAEYSEDQLHQDLNQLVEWKNIIARQETSRVASIEEFKKKRFRYQVSPYTIEIERMVRNLEQLGTSFGGSLEKTLFDRLLAALTRFASAQGTEGEELNGLWEDIFDAFSKLTKNATDYLAHLQSEKVEELMMTEAFLAYKDSLSDYLRNFVAAMQRTALKIEATLSKFEPAQVQGVFQRLAAYSLSIPRLDDIPDRDELVERYSLQWRNLIIWFLGDGNRPSDLLDLRRETHEAIRRITRFAQRLGERHHNHKSLRREYLHLAQRFADCHNLEAAHILSACVFGLNNTRHFWAPEKDTEDIYAEVWDRPAAEIIRPPRVRNYRPKTRPNAIIDNGEEKEAMLRKYLQFKEEESRLLDSLISEGRIEVGNLGVIEPHVRRTLLAWITRALSNDQRVVKTEAGRILKLHQGNRQITLCCTDGNLEMPDYVLEVVV